MQNNVVSIFIIWVDQNFKWAQETGQTRQELDKYNMNLNE